MPSLNARTFFLFCTSILFLCTYSIYAFEVAGQVETCATNEVATITADGLECVPLPAATGGGGGSIPASACGNRKVVKGIGTDGRVVCGVALRCPVGEVFRGLTGTGTPDCVVPAADVQCSGNEVLQGIGTDGAAVCSPALGCPDTHEFRGLTSSGATNCVTRSTTSGGSVQAVSCSGNEVLQGIGADGAAVCVVPAPGVQCPIGKVLQGFSPSGATVCITVSDGERGERGEKGEKGDKGDTGDTGPQGNQGIQGIQGIPGPAGSGSGGGGTGPQGPQGIQGPEGPTGPKGLRGEKGDPGEDGSAESRTLTVDNCAPTRQTTRVINSDGEVECQTTQTFIPIPDDPNDTVAQCKVGFVYGFDNETGEFLCNRFETEVDRSTHRNPLNTSHICPPGEYIYGFDNSLGSYGKFLCRALPTLPNPRDYSLVVSDSDSCVLRRSSRSSRSWDLYNGVRFPSRRTTTRIDNHSSCSLRYHTEVRIASYRRESGGEVEEGTYPVYTRYCTASCR